MSQEWRIPEYIVRVSKRARQVTIKVSPWTGLEVVVPVGFKQSGIQKILQSKADWIKRSLENTHPVEELKRPTSIDLNLLDETWTPDFSPTDAQKISLSEQPGRLLRMTGPVDDPVLVAAALNQWLQKRAKKALPPWLDRLSSELSLPFSRVSVRRQRTKWGSCSAEKSISLNRNLLFLSQPLARYVLVHELCHCRQLDHSNRFWSILETYEPNARDTATKVRKDSESVPRWALI
jgi:predicted metal-dependent hydrolase